MSDIRYALRMIRRNPGFTAVIVVTLMLGSGVNAALFQLLDAVRLRTLPVPSPEQLVEIRADDMTHARGTWLRPAALTNPIWEQIRQRDDVFSGLFAWADEPIESAATGEFRKVAALWVSGDFFHVLGVKPRLGRLFIAADDVRGCGYGPGVVISYGYWQRAFGGAPAIVGQSIGIGKSSATVIGVAAAEFSGLEVGHGFDVALPICAEPAWHGANARLDSGTVWWLTVMGRMQTGVSLERADALIRASSPGIFAATLPANYPAASVQPYRAMTLTARPAGHGLSRLREHYTLPLVVLLAVAGVVLAIACGNLAHLLLARASRRRQEIAVRLAIGASRGRLARQLLVEVSLPVAAGIAGGLLVGRAVAPLVVSLFGARDAAVALNLSLDIRTFAFAAALMAATCLTFASIPIVITLRAPGAMALAQRGASPDRGRSRVRHLLLVSQVALALALVVAALVFVESLRNLSTLDAGFDLRGVVVADVNFGDLRFSPDRAVAFHRELLDAARQSPGVVDASEVLIPPLTNGNWNNRVWMNDSDPDRARVVYRNMIGPGYFHTLNTAVVTGREFDDHDLAESSRRVAIVNEAFAHAFGLAPAVGARFRVEATPFEPSTVYEIVGVVRNTKYRDLREAFQPVAFLPLSPAALRRPSGQLVIRSMARPDAAIASIRRTLESLNPGIRYSLRPFSGVAAESLLRERLMASLAAPFGVLGVALAALGLYGVVAYSVAQRAREIGIRMSLGADGTRVIALVLRESAAAMIHGLLLGVALTIASGRFVAALLFGVTPADSRLLAVAVAAIGLVGALASYLPARRAARIEPATALRHN